jgi:sugar O-acyltransferase (sialic acid O-acetyltransferase NeuD family)
MTIGQARERVVIVGTGETAALALEYFLCDSPHEVVAFAAERQYLTSDFYCGLPAVSFEQLASRYPPGQYRAFVAVSAAELNRVRGRLYEMVKTVGFDCVSYVSSRAFVAGSVALGENAFVLENTALQHDVRVGDNVFIGSGTSIGHSSVIEDGVFAGPGVTVCGFARVGCQSFLGAGSCIADCLDVAADCLIGAGAVILKDTLPGKVYLGNPARPVGQDSLESARNRDREWRDRR